MRKDVQDRRSDVQITPRTFWEPALYAAPFLLVCMTFVIWPVMLTYISSLAVALAAVLFGSHSYRVPIHFRHSA